MLKLREIRVQRKMTQMVLAQRVGVAQGVISDIENGRCYPSFKLLVKLARALECSMDELVDLSEDSVAS